MAKVNEIIDKAKASGDAGQDLGEMAEGAAAGGLLIQWTQPRAVMVGHARPSS